MGVQINDVLERIKLAQQQHDDARACGDPMERHAGLRMAYGSLAQAAQDAYMYFTTFKDNNIFMAEGGLHTSSREELERITRICGSQYNVQGLVPAQRMEDEFGMWVERVRKFVGDLDQATRLDSGKVPARDWKEEEIRRKRKQLEDFQTHMFDATGGVGGFGF
ncbi:MAG: hypothetical protein IJJ14_03485 [Coriobacteriales bacterium]|nr:hypothetical protein [Coriobacteriales bacterium]